MIVLVGLLYFLGAVGMKFLLDHRNTSRLCTLEALLWPLAVPLIGFCWLGYVFFGRIGR